MWQSLLLLLLLTLSTTITAFSAAPLKRQLCDYIWFCSSHPQLRLNMFDRQQKKYNDEGIMKNKVNRLNWLSPLPPRSASSKYHARNNKYRWQRLPILLQRLIFQWRGLRQKIRQIIYRNTVYVLECENDKYYVGSTGHRRQRYRQHFDEKRGGSTWTRMHKPIRVVKEYKRIPIRYLMGMESQITSEYMVKYGVNNVRGASFCFSRNFSTADIATLTGFLGHYNQLDYKELHKELKEILPPPLSSSSPSPVFSDNKKNRFVTFNKKNNNKNKITNNSINQKTRNYNRKLRKKTRALKKERDVCFRCGKRGHWASECPNKTFDDRLDTLFPSPSLSSSTTTSWDLDIADAEDPNRTSDDRSNNFLPTPSPQPLSPSSLSSSSANTTSLDSDSVRGEYPNKVFDVRLDTSFPSPSPKPSSPSSSPTATSTGWNIVDAEDLFA